MNEKDIEIRSMVRTPIMDNRVSMRYACMRDYCYSRMNEEEREV